MPQILARFCKKPAGLAGKILLEPLCEIDGLKAYVEGHETEPFRVEIVYSNHRSLDQNARFHAILPTYAKAAGLTPEEAKVQLKHEFGVSIPYGPQFVPPDREGRFVELYDHIEFQVSTAHYTKAEMARLMEGLDYSLAQLGVYP